jgi:uncharacterized protein (TIGR00290 family)
MKAVSLWSGGKDSCFACYKAKEDGFEIKNLINFISPDTKKSFSHNLDAQLILEQANATGINLIQKETSKDNYEENFKEVISELKRKGTEAVIFGDIYLQEHKDWIESVCRQIDIKPLMPLWGKETGKLIQEFIDANFEALIVRVRRDILTKEYLGRKIDNAFIKYLSKNIDPCGERGEFHSLVTNGPLFKRRLKITKTKKNLKENFWILDILSYETYEI